ncbi:hypothetical protein Tco_0464508 [Tanacetum coccineum]
MISPKTKHGNKRELSMIRDHRGQSEDDLKDYAIIDSWMLCKYDRRTRTSSLNFKDFKGGYVAFGMTSKGGRISGKEPLRHHAYDFEKVSYVEELND